MNKSKEFFESQIEKFDDAYWNAYERFTNCEKELKQLQNIVNSHKFDMENAKKERDFYQELLDDLINNE